MATWAIDFDGTVHDQGNRVPGRKMGQPYPGAREALQEFRNLGDTIVIHTCRARLDVEVIGEVEYRPGSKHVADWLDFFEIPYDEITAIKPLADAYIDDKAIPFQGDWDSIRMELTSLRWLGASAPAGADGTLGL